jgi:hypothetical protein
MNRTEHLDWSKKRALDELELGSMPNAIASMLSDLGKHPELEKSAYIGSLLAMTLRTPDQVKYWIEGFN